jgi:hemoglobin
MKKDISKTKDIENLIDTFYEKVKRDEAISHYFLKVNWGKHLPVMYKFWENVLFYTGNYSGNPLQKHLILNERNPLSIEDFNRWVEIFIETVNEHYEGENAEQIKQRAQSIATIMQIKILK